MELAAGWMATLRALDELARYLRGAVRHDGRYYDGCRLGTKSRLGSITIGRWRESFSTIGVTRA
jgi:hypothetical protein